MTAQLLWDGTFSTEAVAAAGLERLDQLHAEAMATIAALAENWDQPVGTDRTADDDDAATSWSDPESWSAEDDELPDVDDEDEDDDAPVLVLAALPPLPPLPPVLRRPRLVPNGTAAMAPNVTAPARAEGVRQLASA